MIDTLKEVADNFCGDKADIVYRLRSSGSLNQSGTHPYEAVIDDAEEYIMSLRRIIRNAHLEATSGRYVDRAVRAQRVLEDAMSEWDDEV